MNLDRQVRQQLVTLLNGGNAHMPFQDAVADFPEAKINHRPANVDYTFWHLVEHLRITQRDILNYLMQADYVAPEWPREYWPAPDAVTDKAGWEQSITDFEADLAHLVAIVSDPATDLTATVPSNDQHTALREVLIVADHNAYHIGELGILRQIDSAWGPSHQQ
jgi:hypothetical protein